MILHFDFSSGAAGDKILGGLLEVCEQLELATMEQIEGVARALVPNIRVVRGKKLSGGIAATTFAVSEPGEHHQHRHWGDISALIEQAADNGLLSERARALAIAVFTAVARAEATVHGVEPERVHFHEVGAADSIVDIVCGCFLLAALDPIAVYATPLALGSGTVHCAHGELPVPAPATAILVQGLPVYASAYAGELTTPTGAALATTFVTRFAPLPPCVPLAVGYGAGSRELDGCANVVRVLAGDAVSLVDSACNLRGRAQLAPTKDDGHATVGAASCRPPEHEQAGGQQNVSPTKDEVAPYHVEHCVLLESNIDHLSAEALAFVAEELLAKAGVLDVWQEPIVMKKGRLATRFCVLATPTYAEPLAEAIIELTHTLGVRKRLIERTVVRRAVVELDTPYGKIPFKAAAPDDPTSRAHWLRPEHENVAQIARKNHLDYNAVYDKLLLIGNSRTVQAD